MASVGRERKTSVEKHGGCADFYWRHAGGARWRGGRAKDVMTQKVVASVRRESRRGAQAKDATLCEPLRGLVL
jgi:hypothetical protein